MASSATTTAPQGNVLGDRLFTIPIENTKDQVQFTTSELPADCEDVVGLLRLELADLNTWHAVACEYYRLGRVDQFLNVLNEENLEAFDEVYDEDRKGRVRILNTLAAYYIQEGYVTRDSLQRKEFFNRASSFLNNAERIDNEDPSVWVTKGILMFQRGPKMYENALTNFGSALAVDPDNIPCLLGKGCILYHGGNYREALECYERALRLCPTLPPCARMGLGLCYDKLGARDVAVETFDRVLQLDPTNVEALVAHAICDLNTSREGLTHNAELVHSALQKFAQAFRLNPAHPTALNHLANHCFYKDEYELARKLASTAFHASRAKEVKAEALYTLARSYHAEGHYDQAMKHYKDSVKHWTTFTLPQFGIGQVLIYQGKLTEAVGAFEKVLRQHQDNLDTQRILGSLYLQLYTKAPNTKKEEFRKKAVNFLKTSVVNSPHDVEAYMELAQLLELASPKEALNALRRAERILSNEKKSIPKVLHNNQAVLYSTLGRFSDALECYFKAIRNGDEKHALETFDYANEDSPVPLDTDNTTIMYNIGRLYQEHHKNIEARRMYKAILDIHPNYVDCALRLAEMCEVEGNFSDAQDYIQQAIGTRTMSVDSWISFGNLLFTKGEMRPAQKKYERVLEKCGKDGKDDTYCLNAIANIQQTNARRVPKDKINEEDRLLNKAFSLYASVLRKDSTNVYAANGIGTVLAAKGYIHEAKDVFLKVREATSEIPDVWLNLAHCYTLLGQHAKAVQLYEQAQEKFFQGNSADIHLHIARTYFYAENFKSCRRHLSRALRLNPTDMSIHFNIALSRQEQSVRVLVQNKTAKVEAVKQALQDLEIATAVFKSLATQTFRKKIGYDPRKAQTHYDFCAKTAQKTKDLLKQAEDKEQQEREEVRRTKARMEEMRREREAKIAEEQRKKEEAEQERVNRARELEANLGQLKEQWVTSKAAMEEAEQAAQKGGKGKKKVVVADLESDSESDSDDVQSKKKKSKKKRALESISEGVSDDEGQKTKKKRSGARLDDDSSSSSVAAAAAPTDPVPAPEGTEKSAHVISIDTNEEVYDFANDLDDSDSS